MSSLAHVEQRNRGLVSQMIQRFEDEGDVPSVGAISWEFGITPGRAEHIRDMVRDEMTMPVPRLIVDDRQETRRPIGKCRECGATVELPCYGCRLKRRLAGGGA